MKKKKRISLIKTHNRLILTDSYRKVKYSEIDDEQWKLIKYKNCVDIVSEPNEKALKCLKKCFKYLEKYTLTYWEKA